MNIILFGFPSCGKTFLGKHIARKTGYNFIDTDDLIKNSYKKIHKKQLSIREIYINLGEKNFRDFETVTIKNELLNVKNCVIATGGGVMMNLQNIEFFKKTGKLIYLRTEKKVIKERLFSKPLPSFICHNNPKEAFESFYQKRLLIYENIEAQVVDTNQKNMLSLLIQAITEE